MADNVRGLTVDIAADTKKFKAALRELDRGLAVTNKEIKAIQDGLKLEYDASKVVRGQELVNRALDDQKKRLELLQARYVHLSRMDPTPTIREAMQTLEKDIARADTRIIQLKKTSEDLDKMKLDHAAAEAKKLTDEADKVAAAIKKAEEEAKTLNAAELKKINTEFKLFHDSVEKAGKNLEKMGKAVMPLSVAAGAGLTFATKAAVDMESAMAGVAKTTDLTDAELAAMKDSVIALSKEIPVAATELAGIAENAGQLGIQKENILSFTRVMADLGVATNLTGEEAAQMFAKFANITQMSQGDFDRLGSTIVDLGNNSATTEADIANMSMRLAAAGSQAGMTQAEILGIAAAASSLGLEAEAGGTAFSRTINEITLAVQTGKDSVSDFAAAAGISAEQFKSAWLQDAAGTFVQFLEGLGSASEGTLVKLNEMGIEAIRQTDALARAAGSGDLMRQSLERANQAWMTNTALQIEAEKRYETTASQLEIVKNKLTALGIEVGGKLLPVVGRIIDSLGKGIETLERIDKATGGLLSKIGLSVAALGPLLIVTGKLTGAISSGIKMFQTLKLSFSGLDAATKAATASQMGLNAAMVANPAGALITVLGGLAAVVGGLALGFSLAGDGASEAADTAEKYMEATDSLTAATNALAEAQERAAAATGISATQQRIDTQKKASEVLLELKVRAEEYLAAEKEVARIEEENSKITEVYIAKYSKIEQVLDDFYNKTWDTAEGLQALQNDIQEVFGDRFNFQVTKLAGAINVIEPEFKSLQNEMSHANDVVKENAANIEAARGFTDEYAVSLSLLVNSGIMSVVEAANYLNISVDDVNGALARAKDILRDVGKSASDDADAMEEIQKATDDLSKSTQSLHGELKTLSDAYNTLQKGESLSLENLQMLIAKYPEVARYIAATGDVTLQGGEILKQVYEIEREEFNLKLQAERQKFVATKEAVEGRIRLYEAEMKALAEVGNLSGEHYFRFGSSQVTEWEKQAKEAQDAITTIDALARTAGGISISGGGSRSSGGGSSRSSSQPKQKTEEEVRLEAYKKARADLEYERNMSNKSELETQTQFYEGLKALQAKYLKENSDEWRKINVELHKREIQQQKEELQQQKDLLANNQKELEFLHNVGIDSDQIYYDKLAELAQGYLKVYGENSEEYRRLVIQINNWEESQRKDKLNQRMKDADYYHTIGVYDEQTYYRKLAELAQEYLLTYGEFSDEYRRLVVQLHDWEQKENESHISKLEQQIKESFAQKRQAIEEEIKLYEKRTRAIIESIDAEIDARRRLREDEDYDAKVRAAQRRLEESQKAYEFRRGTDDEKAMWDEVLRRQQELEQAIQDRDDMLFYRQKEDEKQAAQAALEAFKEDAQRRIEELNEREQRALSSASLDSRASSAAGSAASAASVTAGVTQNTATQTVSSVNNAKTFHTTVNATTPQNTGLSANMLGFVVTEAIKTLFNAS